MLQSLRLLQARLEAGRALRRTARQPRSLEKQGAGLGAKTGAGTRPLPFASWAGRRSAGTQSFPVRALLPRSALMLAEFSEHSIQPEVRSPKGASHPSPGRRPGWSRPSGPSPERAAHFVPPLQGWRLPNPLAQGVALGWHGSGIWPATSEFGFNGHGERFHQGRRREGALEHLSWVMNQRKACVSSRSLTPGKV